MREIWYNSIFFIDGAFNLFKCAKDQEICWHRTLVVFSVSNSEYMGKQE
jgi:hypothetical protein